MAEKYEIPETNSDSSVVNEPPAIGYGTDISCNQAELDREIDFDLERAITMEELLERIKADIHEMYKKKK